MKPTKEYKVDFDRDVWPFAREIQIACLSSRIADGHIHFEMRPTPPLTKDNCQSFQTIEELEGMIWLVDTGCVIRSIRTKADVILTGTEDIREFLIT